MDLLMIAFGLSMDAFAVSTTNGMCVSRQQTNRFFGKALSWSAMFGLFQGLMPLLGYFLGRAFSEFISSIDHWVAFVLLAFIGGKMLWEAFHEDEEGCDCEDTSGIDLREFCVLAVATSIDALAAGISFAALSVDIVASVSLIGVITFALSLVGVAVGHFFGSRYEKPASVTGGVVLILIGLKVLLEHLGVL